MLLAFFLIQSSGQRGLVTGKWLIPLSNGRKRWVWDLFARRLLGGPRSLTLELSKRVLNLLCFSDNSGVGSKFI